MDTYKFNYIKSEISEKMNNIYYDGDLSDIGNEIGLIIGKYIEKDKLGYELEDFIAGLKHGISLIDGTH